MSFDNSLRAKNLELDKSSTHAVSALDLIDIAEIIVRIFTGIIMIS